MRKLHNIMVTGGAGFIGSNFIRRLYEQKKITGLLLNFDSCTYAGNPKNLSDIASKNKNYHFLKADIREPQAVEKALLEYKIDTIVHFAAESHVDRSITGPADFIETNVLGTFHLLEAAKKIWPKDAGEKGYIFHHVSTDEVFGSLGRSGFFTENTAYDPQSPYSASKASSDHLVRAWAHTYALPVTITNCSNNYGPYQFPEKLIPLMIQNCIEEKPLPVYGQGLNIRDWLYVDDHADAVWQVMTRSKTGETWTVGGQNEWKNIDIVNLLCEIMGSLSSRPDSCYKKLITFVADRPGHDMRYAVDISKISRELSWKPSVTFEQGLRQTVKWYLENQEWVNEIKKGSYREWIQKNYAGR